MGGALCKCDNWGGGYWASVTNTGGGWVKCETHALSGEARHEDAEGLLFYRITEGVSWREPREPEFRGVSWGGGEGGEGRNGGGGG